MLWVEYNLPLLASVGLLSWILERALGDILRFNMHCTREEVEAR